MKKYIIEYYFDGNGKVEVEAKNQEEAREKFFNGDFDETEEYGENYNIERISYK